MTVWLQSGTDEMAEDIMMMLTGRFLYLGATEQKKNFLKGKMLGIISAIERSFNNQLPVFQIRESYIKPGCII